MPSDDLHIEMWRHPLDDATADRLLAGEIAPDDAPPGYGHLASLIRRARTESGGISPSRRAAAVSAMAAAVTYPERSQRGSKRMLGKLLSLKALGIALPAVALTAGTAAAATNSLPAPAQTAIHNALSKVGISVPDGNSSSASPVGPNASGPAEFGLCTAYAANGGHASSNSVAFKNLTAAATAAGESVTQYCAAVTTTTSSSTSSSPSSISAVGPNASGPAEFGLCTAYAASGGHMSSNSVAFKNLMAAATAAGESVSQYCTGVMPGGTASSSISSVNHPTSSSNPGSSHRSTSGSDHANHSTPAGPPSSTPGSGHANHTTPAGPPTSTPASSHTSTSTPAGPPSSTPASGSHG